MNDTAILVVAARDGARLTACAVTPWAEAAPPSHWRFQPRAAVETDESWL